MPNPRYTLRKDDAGRWILVDIITDLDARVGFGIMIRMDMDEASETVARLNRMDSGRGH